MAGWRLGKAFIEFTARDRGLSRMMSSLKRVGSGMMSVFKKLAFAAIAVGAAILGASVVLIRAISLQETAEAKLGAVIQSTGKAAGFSKKEMLAYAASLQKVTAFADDVIISGQAILATFVDIKGKVFEDTTKVALDMATVMGTDLKSAMVQLGKAINDPKNQMTALRKSGVSFTEAEKKLIVELQESGKLMQAQGKLLAVLQMQFGGAANAAENTLGGAIKQLKNEFGDFLETLVSTDVFRQVVEDMRSLVQIMRDSPSSLRAFADGLAEIAWSAIRVVDWFGRMRDAWIELRGEMQFEQAKRAAVALRDATAALEEFRSSGEKNKGRELGLLRDVQRATEAGVRAEQKKVAVRQAALDKAKKDADLQKKAAAASSVFGAGRLLLLKGQREAAESHAIEVRFAKESLANAKFLLAVQEKRSRGIQTEITALEKKAHLESAVRKATLKTEEEARKEAENAAKFQTDVLDKIADSKRTAEQKAVAAVKKQADEMRKIAKATGQDVVAINEWEAAEVQKIRDKVEASFAAKIDTNKEKATELGDALKEAMSVTPEWVGLQDLYKRMATASKSDKQGRIANILEQQKKLEEAGNVLARQQAATLEAIRTELAAGGGPGGTGIAAGP